MTQDYFVEFFESQNCVLKDTYKNAGTMMTYICKCGNESRIRFRDFKRGQRCRDCGIKKYSGKNHPRRREDRQLVEQEKLFKQKVYDALKYCLKQMGTTKKAELMSYWDIRLKN